MRKIKIIFTLFIVAMVSLTVACKDKDSGGDEPEPTPVTAKYLTSAQFASSNWTGKDAKGNDVKLAVNSTSEMTLTYFESKSISKNTDNQEKKTVKISYTFDEANGSFSGTGDDKNSYSGTLTSAAKLSLTMPAGTVSLDKQ
jgi:hypothetical protein